MIRILPALGFLGFGLLASVRAQTADPAASQIGPGSTGSISHGVKPTAASRPHQILKAALTPETRDRLQQAMDSAPTPIPSR